MASDFPRYVVLRFGSEAVVAVRLARVPNERSIWLDDLLTSHAMRRDLARCTPCFDDPLPDYDTEPVVAFSAS